MIPGQPSEPEDHKDRSDCKEDCQFILVLIGHKSEF